MRPNTIINFERMMFATLALGMVQSWIAWDKSVQIATPAFILTVQIITFSLIVGITLLISRRRSKVAMWVFITMFVLGLIPHIWIVAEGQYLGVAWLGMVQFLLQVFALGLLFTRESRAWLNRQNADGDPGAAIRSVGDMPTDTH